MSGLVHNFAARKRKRDAILEQAVNAIPERARGLSHPCSDGGWEVLAIVISGSPEMGLDDQPTMGNITLEESKEASSVPTALQVVHIPEQATSQLDKAKYTQTGFRKPLLPDRMLMNSYLPPCDPTPPMEEVISPGPEGAQEIVERWRPFNRGEYSADHLHDLYPTMLRMLVTIQAGGQGEEYNISVPCGTSKEDLQQMIEDGMQVRNRNFDQSTELVSLEAFFSALVLFSYYWHITNMFPRRWLLLSGTWPSNTENSRPG